LSHHHHHHPRPVSKDCNARRKHQPFFLLWLAGWLAQANHHNNNDQSNKSHLDDEAEGKSKCLGHMPFSTPFLYHLWTDANNTLNGFR
jgi:hypothetical protein